MLSLLTALSLMFAAACGSYDGDPPAPGFPDRAEPLPLVPNQGPVQVKSGLKCEDSTSLTYNNFGKAFLLNYCTTCHASTLSAAARYGAPLEVNLDTLEGVWAWRPRILSVTAESSDTPMPPSSHVPPLERSRLVAWLKCGAP